MIFTRITHSYVRGWDIVQRPGKKKEGFIWKKKIKKKEKKSSSCLNARPVVPNFDYYVVQLQETGMAWHVLTRTAV